MPNYNRTYQRPACILRVSLSVMSDSATPWSVAHQAPLSMQFSRQEYWSRLSFLFPGGLPDAGIEPRSPALQVNSNYHLNHHGGCFHTNHSTISCNINLITILWERDDNLLLLKGKMCCCSGLQAWSHIELEFKLSPLFTKPHMNPPPWENICLKWQYFLQRLCTIQTCLANCVNILF